MQKDLALRAEFALATKDMCMLQQHNAKNPKKPDIKSKK